MAIPFNVLAAGVDDESAELTRGEFRASSRYLAQKWNWPRTTVQRFFRELEAAGTIARAGSGAQEENRVDSGVGHSSGQSTGRLEGRFIIRNYETYNPARASSRAANRATSRANIKEVVNEIRKEVERKDTHMPAGTGAPLSPKILLDIYRQNNQALPEVKALTAERLRKCRSRIDQAVRDGCLEQYLADFGAAVNKAQSTPFLRGEGARGWPAGGRASTGLLPIIATRTRCSRASTTARHRDPVMGHGNRNGKRHGLDSDYFDCDPGETSSRRTSRGDPIYRPRQ